MPTNKIDVYVCDNCPNHPTFFSLQELTNHWGLTHTVSMIEIQEDPWGERPSKKRTLYHVESTEVVGRG